MSRNAVSPARTSSAPRGLSVIPGLRFLILLRFRRGFPGGMPGARNLGRCSRLISLMKAHYAAGGTLAAICAAPGLVLSQLDDVRGVDFTCYDGFADPMESKGAVFVPKPAVTDGRIITGRGPGHTKAFALEIVKKVKGEAVAAEVAYGMNLTCE